MPHGGRGQRLRHPHSAAGLVVTAHSGCQGLSAIRGRPRATLLGQHRGRGVPTPDFTGVGVYQRRVDDGAAPSTTAELAFKSGIRRPRHPRFGVGGLAAASRTSPRNTHRRVREASEWTPMFAFGVAVRVSSQTHTSTSSETTGVRERHLRGDHQCNYESAGREKHRVGN